MPMGSLRANITNQKGRKNVGGTATIPRATAIDLIAALDAVNVIGQQMFERDCLGYTFDLWARPNSDLHREASVSASDVLADIADIRALPSRHPEIRSEEHTSELQSLMRISYAVFCLKKQITKT